MSVEMRWSGTAATVFGDWLDSRDKHGRVDVRRFLKRQTVRPGHVLVTAPGVIRERWWIKSVSHADRLFGASRGGWSLTRMQLSMSIRQFHLHIDNSSCIEGRRTSLLGVQVHFVYLMLAKEKPQCWGRASSSSMHLLNPRQRVDERCALTSML